jgi:hypothetical protein
MLVGVFLVSALLIEGLTEIIKSILANLGLTLTDWMDQLISIVFGMTIAFVGRMDFFALVSEISNIDFPATQTLGIILSGLVLSRGSNAIHDILKKLNPQKQNRIW